MNNRCGKCIDLGRPIEEQESHRAKDCPHLSSTEKTWFMRGKVNRTKSLMERGNEESLQGFNMANYLANLPCGLTIRQAMALTPKYEKAFYSAVKRSKEHNEKEMEANLLETDEPKFTSTRCMANIEGHETDVIIDTRAAVCAITRKLAENLDIEPEIPSDIIITTADGGKHRSLGKTGYVHFLIEGIPTNAKMEVIESHDEALILGMDWIKKNKAKLDFDDKIMEIKTEKGYREIPIKFTAQEDDDEEDEYENEDLREVHF
jgi:hypothetical protein